MTAMHSTRKSTGETPRGIALAFGAALVLLASWFVLIMFDDGDVEAQAGPSPAGCGGEYTSSFGSVGFDRVIGDKIRSDSPTTKVFALGSPLPAGTYAISGVSYDGYTGRENSKGQTQERWVGEFLSASGAILAKTSATGDLADGVSEATWVGSLGQVTLSETATQMRAIHTAIGASSVNSVRPVCIGATLLAPPPTTPPDTAPPATEPPPTTEAPAPPTTGELPAPGPSSITVNKVSSGETDDPLVLTVDCGESGSATGSLSGLGVGDLEPGDVCEVSYDPTQISGIAQISFAVSPGSIIPITSATSVTIEVPTTGLDIVVTVTCTIEGEEIAPETTVAPPATDPPPATTVAPPATDPPAPPPSVQPDDQEPEAKPAEPVVGNPQFTG